MFVDRDKNNISVTQENSLILAKDDLSLNEKRLLLISISKVNPEVYKKDDLSISVKAQEWKNMFPDSNAYRELKNCSNTLLGKHVIFHPSEKITKKVNWLQSIEYDDDKGSVSLTFTPPIKARISGMLEQFSKYKLISVCRLRDPYAIRLYEIISQFKKTTSYRVITIDDLRFALNCQNTYSATKDFKAKIIIPSLKQINELTDIKVTNIKAIDIKEGRKITGFKFHFKDQEISWLQDLLEV
jgi:plasmid replication initiation protein